ncbi:hypothetical protein PRUPE_3G253000 [Prunus persica]|uniref:Phenolic glucoside malonyltransferase 1-like n=1 Tax=Prunus persica TaxID=3760 RepID=A0A251Q582_PRUPE|nr:phenolic glucoside malonyltransferase 1 [Prunus persica]ONI19009.1 hypothetical protein PRUPE_3G253000 [Prunus persica]
MAELNSVRVLEVCNVAPQPSSPAGSATPPPEALPLTLFDLPWLRFAPVQRLFFYEISNSFDTAILVSKLKASLSVALQQFLPLAGNLKWPQDSPKPILSYVQGDAVSLTIAESDADFHHLSSRSNFVEAKEYHSLVPQLTTSHEKAAAVAFQVTIFSNGNGFSIGTSMHHAILDGKSSTMFVKSWAHICKHLGDDPSGSALPDQLKPFFDRRVVQDPAGLEPIFLNQLQNLDGPNNKSLMVTQFKSPPPDAVRGIFVITRPEIEAMKQWVSTKMAEMIKNEKQSDRPHLSTFSVTCAYTWVCLLKAEEKQTDKPVMMGFTLDCRPRFDPPIPANYFGNCIAGRAIVAERKGLLGEDGLTVAVNEISEAIKSADSDRILKGAETLVPVLYPAMRSEERVMGVAGSPRFGIYDTDFGWGRPSKVEVVSIEETGAMSLAESRDGIAGDFEVGLVLEKHHMQAFASLFAKGLQDL